MLERRQFTRYSVPLGVQIAYEAGGESRHEQCTTCNISIGGVLLPLSQTPDVDGEITLTLRDDAGFLASALQTPVHSPKTIRFRLQARMVRRRSLEDGSGQLVALEFISPLRILRDVA